VRFVMMLIWLGLLAFDGRSARHAAHDVPNELQGFVPTNVKFYVDSIVALEQGFFVLLLLSAMTCARAIAKDRATNALELYWTRGISPLGYFLGKWLGGFLLIGCLTILGPALLWLTGALLAEDWSFLQETIGFVPSALAGLTAFTIVFTALGLLVSAVSSSANVAMILWCILLGGSLAASGAMRELTNDDQVLQFNVWECAATLARACTGTVPPYGSVGGALVMLGALVVVLVVVARRRLRTTEAIA